jgi:hypothetical protein
MRVVARAKDGREAVSLYAHEDLETCVGVAIAAFAAQLLVPGRVPPGVYYPEEGACGRAWMYGWYSATMFIANRFPSGWGPSDLDRPIGSLPFPCHIQRTHTHTHTQPLPRAQLAMTFSSWPPGAHSRGSGPRRTNKGSSRQDRWTRHRREGRCGGRD